MTFAQRNSRKNSPFFKPHQGYGEEMRPCEYPNCEDNGEYKAPRSPKALRQWRWFCLKHVRDYNKAWNYFSGWSEEDIQTWQREDLTGHRPTWPMGSGANSYSEHDYLENQFRHFAKDWFENMESIDAAKGFSNQNNFGNSKDLTLALNILDLTLPFSISTLKSSYKRLVKLHHPDANGGSKTSEELLKSINEAYTYLLKKLK